MPQSHRFVHFIFFSWLLILLKQFLNRYFTFKKSDSGDYLFSEVVRQIRSVRTKITKPSSEENRNL